MSERTVRMFLVDILEAIDKIRTYTSGLSFDQFQQSPMVVDAVLRNLEIIGEAARHIPSELRASHSSIEWRRVVGLRNVVIHSYFGVDLEIVWTVATQQLPELEKTIRHMLDDQETAAST